MARLSTTEQLIAEEIAGHIDDARLDFVEQGMTEEEANARAVAEFGDVEAIEAETLAEHSTLTRLRPSLLLFIAYIGAGAAMLSVIPFVDAFTQASIEPWLLYWVFFGVAAGETVLVHWLCEFLGLESFRVVPLSILYVLLATIPITIVLDIDNFEVNVHLALLGGLVVPVLWLLWSHLSIMARRLSLYAFSIIAIWVTLLEKLVFGFIGEERCLFLTPDTIPLVGDLEVCEQLPFTHPTLWPLYTLLLIGIPTVASFLWQYWQSRSTNRLRKIVMTGAIMFVPLSPLFAYDVNNLGELDVIRWKSDIVLAYNELLDRDPEEKDIVFYAQTRAYLDMDRVRAALNESEERRVVISAQYKEQLGRDATEEEIEQAIQESSSITELYAELEQ